GKVISIFCKPVLCFLSGNIGARKEKLLLVMLFQYFLQVLSGLLSKENLTLSVLNIFLKIKSNCFRKTEVLKVGWYIVAHFLTDAKKMIDSILAGKNNGCEICQIDAFFSEILGRHTLHMNKRSEI